MKKAIRGMWEFFRIIGYGIGILWGTSGKNFMIRIILNIVSLAAPFVVIALIRSLINFLADANTSVSDTVIQLFLTLSLLLVGCNILSKAFGTSNTCYAGLHSDMLDAVTKHRVMEKATELDLSFFDSTEFYNEVNDANRNSPLITYTAFHAMDLIRYFVQFLIAFAYLFPFGIILPFVFVFSVIPCIIVRIKQVEAIYGFQRQYMSEERKMQYASAVLLSREFAKDIRIYNIYLFISGKFLEIWNTLFSKREVFHCGIQEFCWCFTLCL